MTLNSENDCPFQSLVNPFFYRGRRKNCKRCFCTLQNDKLNESILVSKPTHLPPFLFLDDLEVKDPRDREILLKETARLASTKSDKSQLSETQDMTQREHVLDTPVITVSNFDEGDPRPKLVLLCDDDDFPYNKRKKSSDEFINQRIINLAYSDGEESTTDDGSERDFSFKNSNEEHDFSK